MVVTEPSDNVRASSLEETCAKLTELSDRASRQRRCYSIGLVLIGVLIWPMGLLLGFLRAGGALSEDWGPDGIYFAFGLPGIFASLICVLPTDKYIINLLAKLWMLYFLASLPILATLIALAAAGIDGYADRSCNPTPATVSCVTYLAHWGFITLVVMLGTAAFTSLVFRPTAQAYSPRKILRLQWNILRACYVGFGFGTWMYVLVRLMLEGSQFLGSSMFWGSVAHATADLVGPALSGQSSRRHTQRLLRWASGAQDDDRAASIAAMVGGVGVAKASELAGATFRTIPYGSLRFDDFLNGDLASECSELRGRTRHTDLGVAEAFMSHSWRDDAHAKWHTLKTWAAAWSVAHGGRDPKLWFDRACLDQQNIDESLAMLPIYLSGCKLMLVLAGDTYTTRLWCVMEVFTWLSISPNAENLMVVLPLVRPMRPTVEIFRRRSAADAAKSERAHGTTSTPASNFQLTLANMGAVAAPAEAARPPPLSVDTSAPSRAGSNDSAESGHNSSTSSSPRYTSPRLSPGTPRGRLGRMWKAASQAAAAKTVASRRAHARFAVFRAQHASCFRPSDKDRLLSIIESSFGTFHAFNIRVRTAFIRQAALHDDRPLSETTDAMEHALRFSTFARDLVEESRATRMAGEISPQRVSAAWTRTGALGDGVSGIASDLSTLGRDAAELGRGLFKWPKSRSSGERHLAA